MTRHLKFSRSTEDIWSFFNMTTREFGCIQKRQCRQFAPLCVSIIDQEPLVCTKSRIRQLKQSLLPLLLCSVPI